MRGNEHMSRVMEPNKPHKNKHSWMFFISKLNIWQATFWSHGYSLLIRHVTEEIT